MKFLVVYASSHGATHEIGERIATVLERHGHQAAVEDATRVSEPETYDAFVVGSAAYIGHWLPEAAEFVRREHKLLAAHPTWLFSSGPLGSEETDTKGRDVRSAAEPDEIDEFRRLIRPRGHRVFFGALDPRALRLRDRLIRSTPAGRSLLPEGDFRDWSEIEEWAADIASQFAPVEAVAS